MTKDPLVSVIIPTYKNRGGLLNSINSVISQTYQNLEIIVVDDNNPDDTWRKETERLMEDVHDTRVIYIKHQANRNGAAARNTGIKKASGEYIAFLDDDDYFFPNKIEEQVNFLANNSDFKGVYCQGERRNKLIASDLKEGDLTEDILCLKSYMFTPSLMFRREVFNTLNGFDESFVRHQDYELLLRFFKQGYKIGAVQKLLFGIGANNGENIPSAAKFEKLKIYFFEKFESYINNIESTHKGFRKKVYSIHYSTLFLGYIKEKDIKNSFRIFNAYFWTAPAYFIMPILKSAITHLKRTISNN